MPSLISATLSYFDVNEALALAPQARFFGRVSPVSNMSQKWGRGAQDSNSVSPVADPFGEMSVIRTRSVWTAGKVMLFGAWPVGIAGTRRWFGMVTQRLSRHISTL